jgi:flagellar M-ring protein FliF
MDLVSPFIERARSLWNAMPPQARLTAGLLALAIIVSSGFLLRGTTSPAGEYLFGGILFSDIDLKQAELAFGGSSLRDYEIVGNRIRVPRAQRDTYLKALKDANFSNEVGDALRDVLGATNPFELSSITAAKMQAAVTKDISTAITRLPYVESAFVRYDTKKGSFGQSDQQTAAVYVTPKAGSQLSWEQRKWIAQMVAFSYSGLKSDNISVMDQSSGEVTLGSPDPESSRLHAYEQMRQRLKRDYEAECRKLLTSYGEVQVAVDVELDPTLRHESEQLKFNDKTTPLVSSSSRRDSESSRQPEGNRPGTEPNALANKPASLQASMSQSTRNKESFENEQSVAGHELTLIERAGLLARRVNLAVRIPRSYYPKAFQRQWQQLNPDTPPSEMPKLTEADLQRLQNETFQSIELLLSGLLPPEQPGSERGKNVTVSDYWDDPEQPDDRPSLAMTGLAWLGQHWQNVGMLGLALIVLGMLWSMSRAKAPATDPWAEGYATQLQAELADLFEAGRPTTAEAAAAGGDTAPQTALEAGRQATGNPRSQTKKIQEDLNRMVQQDPAAAANLLQVWMGEAA